MACRRYGMGLLQGKRHPMIDPFHILPSILNHALRYALCGALAMYALAYAYGVQMPSKSAAHVAHVEQALCTTDSDCASLYGE